MMDLLGALLPGRWMGARRGLSPPRSWAVAAIGFAFALFMFGTLQPAGAGPSFEVTVLQGSAADAMLVPRPGGWRLSATQGDSGRTLALEPTESSGPPVRMSFGTTRNAGKATLEAVVQACPGGACQLCEDIIASSPRYNDIQGQRYAERAFGCTRLKGGAEGMVQIWHFTLGQGVVYWSQHSWRVPAFTRAEGWPLPQQELMRGAARARFVVCGLHGQGPGCPPDVQSLVEAAVAGPSS
jgi:hypothetical protein